VARLHKQRALFRARSREAYERLAKLTGLLDNIDLDFTVSASGMCWLTMMHVALAED
jgi:hypothetical protein